MAEINQTLRFRVHVEEGERERLGPVRFDAQAIANHALAMRQLGYYETDICTQLTLDRHVLTNTALT